MNQVTYALGFAETDRNGAALLYEQAFGSKIAVGIPQHVQRIALFTASFNPLFAFTAVMNDEIVGLAGFQTPNGSLTGGITGRLLWSQLGVIGALRAAGFFQFYTRRPEPSELVLDGIAVRDDMRGHGIGGQLLDHLAEYARTVGFASIRLDVIDTNPLARRLYERKGYRSVETVQFAYLKWLLGYSAATRMQLRVG
jgi:ribosomal protein S18 acetylase RimI-like enzyme